MRLFGYRITLIVCRPIVVNKKGIRFDREQTFSRRAAYFGCKFLRLMAFEIAAPKGISR